MRIDQLPVAASVSNTNTLPVNVDGFTKQVNIGNLTNSIRDNVYGAPLTASTSAGMTDQTKVYVYTGTTGDGYTNGHWYYYNGSAWTDGGVYNSSAVQTDTTLTLAGVPADAAAVGGELTDLKSALAVIPCAITPWVSGYLRNNNGTVGSDSAYAVCSFFTAKGRRFSISIADGYKLNKICEYNAPAESNNAFVQAFINLNAENAYSMESVDGHYYRCQISKVNGGTISLSDLSESTLVITYLFTDTTLSKAGKAADAKTAGDLIASAATNIADLKQKNGLLTFTKNSYILTVSVESTIDLTPVTSQYIDCVSVPCTKGQVFVITGTPFNGSGQRPYCFANSDNYVVERGDITDPISDMILISPCNGTAVFNFRNDSEYVAYTESNDVSAVITEAITEQMDSSNIFDGDVSKGHYINTEGTVGNSSSLCYMRTYVPVTENDKFIAGTGENTSAQLRYVTAYDENKNVLSAKGLNGGYVYTTPAGVSFVRFSFYLADVESGTFRLNKSAFLQPYESHSPTITPKGYESLENVLNSPLSALPDYIINSLAYKPVGALSKPYICLVSDDGDEDMITYSIPMVESKGVPCTWAIMSTSEMFSSANVATNVATVLDSVNNHGCAIAQHGGTNWTEYTEADLSEFFEREKAFMASYGLTAKSAVIPSHYTSPLVCAVAGGKYGVCRSGLNGQDAHGNTYEEIMKPYPHYTCGARTNIYCLSSQNVSNISQAEAQTVINYINANNGIAIFYWHENSLDSALKQRIEDAIDYGLSLGIEFITLDQIKSIV